MAQELRRLVRATYDNALEDGLDKAAAFDKAAVALWVELPILTYDTVRREVEMVLGGERLRQV